MKLWAKAGVILDGVISFFAILAGAVLIFMMLSVTLDVFMRYFLNQPIFWVVELNEYALLYATFLGAPWVLAKDGHVKVELVVDHLKPKPQAMVGAVTSILGAASCGVLVWFSAEATLTHYVRGVWDPGSLLEIPTAYVMLIIPFGSFLLFVQFLRRSSRYFKKLRMASNKK